MIMGLLDFLKPREKIVREQSAKYDGQIALLNEEIKAFEKKAEYEKLRARVDRLRSGDMTALSYPKPPGSSRKASAAKAKRTTSRTAGSAT